MPAVVKNAARHPMSEPPAAITAASTGSPYAAPSGTFGLTHECSVVAVGHAAFAPQTYRACSHVRRSACASVNERLL